MTNDLSQFWSNLDHLVADCQVRIDRPRGSSHPRYPELAYPLDYGYLEGTAGPDGAGVDLFIGTDPARSLGAIALTVDLLERDAEIKLMLGCTPAELQVAMDFLNSGAMCAWLVRRDGDLDLLLSRRSVRRFRPRAVSPDVLERLLEAATWAPSAHNRQPWRFVVLASAGARRSLADAMGADFRRDLLADGLSQEQVEARVQRSRQRLQEAPAAVLLCADISVGDRYPDEQRQEAEYLMAVQSVAMAGGQLLIAAHALGLAGVWICAPLFARQAVRRALDLPQDWYPQAIILLGYPARIPEPPARRPLEQVTRFL